MKPLCIPALVLTAALCAAHPAWAQPDGQQGQRSGDASGRGARMGADRMNPAVTGLITAIADGQFTVKAENGPSVLVRLTADTRFMDQASFSQRTSGDQPRQRPAGDQPQQRPAGAPDRPTLKAADFKLGDTISAMGTLDAAANSVASTLVMRLDPARIKQMAEMQANFGKTWLSGKLTAVEELTLTLLGSADNAPHPFTVDENTSFRKRNEPITLADLLPNDTLRVEGAVKDGLFLATTVTVMALPLEKSPVRETRDASQPAAQTSADPAARDSKKTSTDAAKSKKKNSSSSDSSDDDPPPPDGPPPGGPPPGGGGPPPGFGGGPPPMGLF